MTEADDDADTDQLRALYDDAREVETSAELDGAHPPLGGNAPAELPDVPGFKILASLLTATLFTDYIHYRAVNRCLHATRQERITRYCEDHRWLDTCCMISDLLFRYVVTVLVLLALTAVIGATIYRTFYMDLQLPK